MSDPKHDFDLIEAESDLKAALAKFQRVSAIAEGQVVLDSYPVDKFVVITAATTKKGTLYGRACNIRDHHEVVGLALTLLDRERGWI